MMPWRHPGGAITGWRAGERRAVTLRPEVFILAGQSNMVGRAVFDGGAGYPSGVYQVTQAGAVVAATTPLDHHDEIGGDMGLALQFAIDYRAANPSRELILLPAAQGGTGFASSEWREGDTLYADLVSRANALFTANPAYRLGGILWHQGEADSKNETDANAYAAELAAMIAGLRSDLSAATNATPFICGGLVPSLAYSHASIVGAALAAVSQNVLHTAYASPTGLTDKGDGLHFDAASLRTLGSRYFTALSQTNSALVEPPEVPDAPAVVAFDHGEQYSTGLVHTFAAASVGDGSVFVAVTARQPGVLPSSVTVGGAGAVLIDSKEYGAEGQYTSFWRLDGASAGSPDVVVTHAVAPDRVGVAVWTVEGAGVTSFFGAHAAGGEDLLTTTDVPANGMVLLHGTYVSKPVASSTQTLVGVTDRLALTEVSPSYNHNGGDEVYPEAQTGLSVGKTGTATNRQVIAGLVIAPVE